MFNDGVYALQLAMNRFARWLRIPTITEDGVMGDHTMRLFLQLASSILAPELFDYAFTRTSEGTSLPALSNADLELVSPEMASVINTRANALGITAGVTAAPEVRKQTLAQMPSNLRPVSLVGGAAIIGAVAVLVFGIGYVVVRSR